jgi:hypothetical protein
LQRSGSLPAVKLCIAQVEVCGSKIRLHHDGILVGLDGLLGLTQGQQGIAAVQVRTGKSLVLSQ